MNPAGWVGDQDNTWDGYGLTLALKNIFISADSGYAAVGSDIGGYLNNDYPPDRNLFLRWVQLGALLPIMENGGQKDNCHLPWLFDPIQSTTDIYRKYAKLHHELVPYFYSYDIQAHSDGISISRPIGHDISDWEGHWEYLLGDNLFVSAIYQDNDTQYSDSKKINFPTGKWINYWNEDEIYNGETSATLTYSLDQYPIFIRSGAIIPMNVDDSETGHGSDSSENYLTLLIYPDGVSSFDYHSDPSTTTRITTDEQCGGIIISFNSYTDSVIIRLKNDVEPERVFLSGNLNLQKKDSFTEFEAPSSGWYHGKLNDSANVYTWIKIVNPTDSIFVATNSVSGITPTAYKLSNLNVGNNQYIDRPSMKLVYIPDEYKGFNMIRTANDNKITTNLGFQFYVCGNADIYVAYDYRLTTPSWITDSYTPTGDTITDDYITPNIYDIWKTTVSPGTVTLGDNNGVFESSMYFVFYRYYESPLPVELSAFEAIVNNNSILLKWETKTEINNYGFELQRTTADNKTWDKIAFIPGSGNSSSTKSYSYLDKNLSGNEFLYRIKQIDSDGSFSYSVELKVELFPLEFEVLQNYPNPFNPKTKIKFSVKNEGMISVKVYDNLGKEIKVLLNEYKAPGFYTLEFDGSGLSSGIYFLKFQEGNLFQTKKLVLMK